MAVQQPPGVINAVSTDAKIQRRVHQAILGGKVGAFTGGVGVTNGAAHGVIGAGHLLVTQSGTPGMSVDVAPGLAFITGTVSAEQGPYNFYNDSTETLVISAADALQPRNDLVVAQVRDATYSGSDNDARLLVITGTPAGSPVDPTVEDNCLVLARVNVPALDTSITDAQITDLRTRAGAYGLSTPAMAQGVRLSVSIPSNTATLINFLDTEDYDPLGWHDTAALSSRFTPTIPGWYIAGCAGTFQAGSDYTRAVVTFSRNAIALVPTIGVSFLSNTAGTVSPHGAGTTGLVFMNGTTDYLTATAIQTNGAAAARTWSGIMWIELKIPA